MRIPTVTDLELPGLIQRKTPIGFRYRLNMSVCNSWTRWVIWRGAFALCQSILFYLGKGITLGLLKLSSVKIVIVLAVRVLSVSHFTLNECG